LVVVTSAIVGLAVLGVVGSDLLDVAPVKLIGLNLEFLREAVASHPWLVAAAYCLAYMGLAAFFLPGSPLMTLLAGMLFGPSLGIVLALTGTTLAATTGFLVARRFGAGPMGRVTQAHPAFAGYRDGFHRNALSYLLFLRLSPGFPFALVNAAPALLGVPLMTFIVGTVIGSLPSRIALSTAGAGLGAVIDAQNIQYSQCLSASGGNEASCPYTIDVAFLLTWQTLAAFVALAFLALAPAIIDFALRATRRRLERREPPETSARERRDP
jgi:uncharacterized membrane protein YdjX (TVP38/TMEM64 family)